MLRRKFPELLKTQRVFLFCLIIIGIAVTMATAQQSDKPAPVPTLVITTEAQLRDFAAAVNGGNDYAGQTIMLGENINLTSNWAPIGNGTVSFRGTFDGNGHSISNLSVSGNYSIAGLFSYIGEYTLIKNLTVNVSSITTSITRGVVMLGGLMGQNAGGGKIENCGVNISGNISTISDYAYVGGLVGYNIGVINNCYAATGNVSTSTTDNSYILLSGGLVGYNYGGKITNSYATVNVSSNGGYIPYNGGPIPTPSFVSGGGLVGHSDNGSIIANSYATGSVSAIGNNPSSGGLVGWNGNSGIITNSYYNRETSGQNDNNGIGIPKSTAEMKQKATFADWDFGGSWRISEGVSYPFHFSVVLLPDTVFTYSGNAIRFSTLGFVSEKERGLLKENVDYTASYSNNTNAGTASVSIIGLGEYSFINTTRQFTINRAQGQGGVSLAGWRASSQPNEPVVFSETNGTDGVTFTYRSIDNTYPESAAKPANPGIYIVKATFPQVQNYNSFTAECEFVISNRDAEPLEVVWTGQTKFQYNKMVQVPIPSVKNKNGEDIPLMVLNGHSAAGEYKGALAALAIIRDEWSRQFYYLTNNTKEYEISKKPLNVVIKDETGNLKDTVSAELNSTNETALIAYVESILAYHGFATDTINNQTDNESVLRGKPRVVIENKTPRSLRNTDISEYLVKIETDDISADNYIIPKRNLNITINRNLVIVAADPRDITSIVKPQKSDSRYGIRFAKNIVSDKAEISVVLPNNERAVETKIVIYDMTGNVVYDRRGVSHTPTKIEWNLTNTAGRNVANGTYLVIAEVRGASGQRYHYSMKLGVKR